MRNGSWMAGVSACAILHLLAATPAPGADVQILSAVGMRQAMLELGPAFERATGHELTIRFDASGVIAKRIEDGTAVDVVIISRAALEKLAAAGRVVEGPGADVASSVAGVAVRRGAPKPDISSPEAFKRALLAAKSVARPDPSKGGASGLHIVKVLERLGILDEVNAKSVLASRPGDPRAMPGALVADGRAEIALHQVQELLAVQGIEIVGPFPAELQERFVFSAVVTTGARQPEAAKALVEFLRTPHAKRVMKAKGMEPVGP